MSGSVAGKVVNLSGIPVAAAVTLVPQDQLSDKNLWVSIPSFTRSTEADGSFEFRNLRPSPMVLAVVAPGYAPGFRSDIEVTAEATEIDLGAVVLEPEATVLGRVVNARGEPVVGAAVLEGVVSSPAYFRSVLLRTSMMSTPAVTRSDGTFALGRFSPGELVQIRVMADGFAKGKAWAIAGPDGAPVEIELQRVARISGTVEDVHGRPVPGATVSPDTGHPVTGEFRTVITDQEGRFEIADAEPGRLFLHADARGHARSEPTVVDVAPGASLEGVRITLREGFALQGRLLDAGGRPVRGAEVWAYPGSMVATTGSQGRFSIEDQPRGPVTVEIQREGLPSIDREVELVPGGGTIEIRLPDSGSSTARPGASAEEQPRRVSLSIARFPGRDLGLDDIGSCCWVNTFEPEPPDFLETVPPPRGFHRRFVVLQLAASKIAVSFEDTEEAPGPDRDLLVQADANQNFDLSDDPLLVCHLQTPCGPIETELRDPAGGSAPYAVALRYFDLGTSDALWYWRAVALTGTIEGTRIAVIDDDTNGSYDDPRDVVVFDRDGDGELDGGANGRERSLRDAPIPWRGRYLSVLDVDPVASELLVGWAPMEETVYQVIENRTGKRIPGARVTVYPGAVSAVSDARGQVTLELPLGPPDFVTTVADGYWGQVLGPGQRAGESAATIRLEPGSCPREGMTWCGRETLQASSVTRCYVDLESGVVGPRVGGTPGAWDVGWFIPPGGPLFQVGKGGGLAVLETADFDRLGADDLRDLDLGRTSVRAAPECGGQATAEAHTVQLHEGSVLAVRTPEGHRAKIRIDSCRPNLELSWVAYGDDPSP